MEPDSEFRTPPEAHPTGGVPGASSLLDVGGVSVRSAEWVGQAGNPAGILGQSLFWVGEGFRVAKGLRSRWGSEATPGFESFSLSLSPGLLVCRPSG